MKKFWTHQLTAWKYAKRKAFPALFMEMRLGKTLTAIRTVKMWKRYSMVLVVAPLSAHAGWIESLEEEEIPNISRLSGNGKTRRSVVRKGWFKAFMTARKSTTYFVTNPECWRTIPEIKEYPWDVVILDESTFLKNPKSKVSAFFCNNFRDVPHRMILTGTPNPEGDLDLFQQMLFLRGGLLNHTSYWSFRVALFLPLGYRWVPKHGTKDRIAKAISRECFVLRRKDVQMEAVRVYEKRTVILPQKLRHIYSTVEEEFLLENMSGGILKVTSNAGARHAWLVGLASGIHDGKVVWDGKVQELLSLLTGELCGESVVVWFERTASLLHAYDYLTRAGIKACEILGATPSGLREKRILAFQENRYPVLLCQSQCGAYGLDLSRSDTAIYYDTPTSTLIRTQSEDRIMHLRKAGKPLLFVDIITEKTVAEDLHRLIVKKKGASATMLDKIKMIQERRATHV